MSKGFLCLKSLAIPTHDLGSIDLQFGQGVFRESLQILISVAFQRFKNSERNGSTSTAFVPDRPPSASEPDHFDPPCDIPDCGESSACLLPVAQNSQNVVFAKSPPVRLGLHLRIWHRFGPLFLFHFQVVSVYVGTGGLSLFRLPCSTFSCSRGQDWQRIKWGTIPSWSTLEMCSTDGSAGLSANRRSVDRFARGLVRGVSEHAGRSCPEPVRGVTATE